MISQMMTTGISNTRLAEECRQLLKLRKYKSIQIQFIESDNDVLVSLGSDADTYFPLRLKKKDR